jgi:signal transduction protein with GAF and PtsI domain
MKLGEGLVGTVAQTGTSRISADVSSDPAYKACSPTTRSEAVIPIKLVTRVFGVINAESDQLNAFGQEDRVLLEGVATRVARYLTSKGKYLLRHAREAGAANAGPISTRVSSSHKLSSEKSSSDKSMRAAAGEKPTR